ncbi:alpha/beta hydrolase [Enterococcus larvae]|uniref:alpha/beta hydrolase n=1 Tax=Enterococcus larvae TaxID=2794352 RepID=UPI003F3A4D85
MKKWKKISIYIGIFIIAVFGAVFFYVQTSTYHPTADAVEASKTAEKEQDVLFFEGSSENPTILFYQGAFVENASYSIWAEQVAAAGFSVYLLKEPLNLAVLGQNAAGKLIEEKQIQSYIIGGHSLGGVMGSRFAHDHLEDQALKGVFFLASYPDEKGSLADFEGSVLSITGENDDVLNKEKFIEAKSYLPNDTQFVDIPGGNHAGFGSYGRQKGDGQATISNEKQQKLVSDTIIQWASQLSV